MKEMFNYWTLSFVLYPWWIYHRNTHLSHRNQGRCLAGLVLHCFGWVFRSRFQWAGAECPGHGNPVLGGGGAGLKGVGSALRTSVLALPGDSLVWLWLRWMSTGNELRLIVVIFLSRGSLEQMTEGKSHFKGYFSCLWKFETWYAPKIQYLSVSYKVSGMSFSFPSYSPEVTIGISRFWSLADFSGYIYKHIHIRYTWGFCS